MPRQRLAPLLLMLAGCAGEPPRSSCLLPDEKTQTVVELFFGRNIRGRPPLSDAEWSDFAAGVITPRFPDGFTAFDGDGQWRDPASGTIVRERSKILVVAVPPAPDLAARIEAVRDAYRARFHQSSVGVITAPACGAF